MASRLKAEIEKKYQQALVELIESSGGVFEVTKDATLIFSKRSEGRFPEDEEIFAKL
jgi:selenoprotein W-related protein